jgi:hypothetical protein
MEDSRIRTSECGKEEFGMQKSEEGKAPGAR